MKHKHYDCIVAWAEGAEIQRLIKDYGWCDTPHPTWIDNTEYRIKPEPRPDIVQEMHWTRFNSTMIYADPNLRLTFDGETGDLKKAEVI